MYVRTIAYYSEFWFLWHVSTVKECLDSRSSTTYTVYIPKECQCLHYIMNDCLLQVGGSIVSDLFIQGVYLGVGLKNRMILFSEL